MDKTCLVSIHMWVLTSLVSGWMLQPSTEPLITSFSVPSDFLVEGQVNGLGTVNPLLTLNFFSRWCDVVM